MFASSSSSRSNRMRASSRLCECDLPVRVLRGWTLTNLARRFIVCPNRSKPNKKNCELWDWYDQELESDWYRLQLREMYLLLNPHEMHLLQTEMTREERILDLQEDLNHALIRLAFWKSTCFMVALFIVILWGMK
ncbi:hypothetical protein Tco_0602103 [Tanacetum coccineum]